MIVSAWIALNLAFFLICVSAIFELRARGKEIELLRAAIKRANQNTATYKALAYELQKERQT